MNINDSSQHRACTSCQICGAVCPTSAISIALNKEGFYRPVVDEEKCIDCGLCIKNCYKFDTEIRLTTSLNSKSLYAAWAKDTKIVNATTSGGIADILAKKLIEEDYTCIGVAYDTTTNCAVGKSANTEKEIFAFRGSKYIQSLSVEIFKELVKGHKNQKYAIFGLPCQIYAIDRFLRLKDTRDQHILIDLYCHGCPTLNLWHKYIAEAVSKVYGKGVISANFRSKVHGWGNFYVVVVVEGISYPIKVISPRTNDPFYDLFFSDTILNDSCYDCSLRSTLEYTDIRLGDFWGKSYVTNHTGVSGVTLCTAKAHEIFNMIRPYINYEEQTFNNFLPYQSYGKDYSKPGEIRSTLLRQIADPNISLKISLKTYNNSLPIKRRMVAELKNLVKLMPDALISSLKSIFFSIRK